MVDQRIRETRATMRWLLTFSLSSAPFVVPTHVHWPRFELDVIPTANWVFGDPRWFATLPRSLSFLARGGVGSTVAVSVVTFLHVVFGDGHDGRLPIGRRSRGKNQLVNTVPNHRIQQIDAAADIGGIKCAGLADGFGNQRFPGKMHHRVNFVGGEYFFKLRAVRQIGLDKYSGGRNGRAMPLLKIIQHDHAMAAAEQHFRADASDVSCASSHKNVQRKSSGSKRCAAKFQYTAEPQSLR